MSSTIEEVAEAFSSHRFAEAYPVLASHVRWNLVGGSPLDGRDAVIEACEASAGFLSQMTTEFRRFKVVVGSDAVAIDSLAEYVDADGKTSVVSSCDIYEFENGVLSAITSYTVEVGTD